MASSQPLQRQRRMPSRRQPLQRILLTTESRRGTRAGSPATRPARQSFGRGGPARSPVERLAPRAVADAGGALRPRGEPPGRARRTLDTRGRDRQDRAQLVSSAATRRDSTMGGTSIDARAELAERAWDSRELEPVDHCPACGAGDRTQLYADLHDRAFGQAPGRWQLWICDACGCHYLPSRPTEASIGRAYADYYTHAVPPEPFPAVEGARRVERRARSGLAMFSSADICGNRAKF